MSVSGKMKTVTAHGTRLDQLKALARVIAEQIDACDDLKALPPDKTCEDKYFIGFFEYEALVGIINLITAYPDDETVFIGFFMLNIKYQHKGIASRIIKESIEYLKTEGYKKIRLGVDKGNPQNFSFWKKNGLR